MTSVLQKAIRLVPSEGHRLAVPATATDNEFAALAGGSSAVTHDWAVLNPSLRLAPYPPHPNLKPARLSAYPRHN